MLKRWRSRPGPISLGPTSVSAKKHNSLPIADRPVDIQMLRRGEFELIDPDGGHKHWMGKPGVSIQKAYLKELSRCSPDAGTLTLLRSIITCGVDTTASSLRSCK